MLVGIGSHSGEDDHIPLVALESIHSYYFNVQSPVEALLT